MRVLLFSRVGNELGLWARLGVAEGREALKVEIGRRGLMGAEF